MGWGAPGSREMPSKACKEVLKIKQKMLFFIDLSCLFVTVTRRFEAEVKIKRIRLACFIFSVFLILYIFPQLCPSGGCQFTKITNKVIVVVSNSNQLFAFRSKFFLGGGLVLPFSKYFSVSLKL